MERITLQRIVKEYLRDRFLPNEDFKIRVKGVSNYIILSMGAGFSIHAIGLIHKNDIFMVTPDDKNDNIRIYDYDRELFEKLDKVILDWVAFNKKEHKNG